MEILWLVLHSCQEEPPGSSAFALNTVDPDLVDRLVRTIRAPAACFKLIAASEGKKRQKSGFVRSLPGVLRAGPCMPGVVGAAGRLSPSARCLPPGRGRDFPARRRRPGPGPGPGSRPGRAGPSRARRWEPTGARAGTATAGAAPPPRPPPASEAPGPRRARRGRCCGARGGGSAGTGGHGLGAGRGESGKGKEQSESFGVNWE